MAGVDLRLYKVPCSRSAASSCDDEPEHTAGLDLEEVAVEDACSLDLLVLRDDLDEVVALPLLLLRLLLHL